MSRRKSVSTIKTGRLIAGKHRSNATRKAEPSPPIQNPVSSRDLTPEEAAELDRRLGPVRPLPERITYSRKELDKVDITLHQYLDRRAAGMSRPQVQAEFGVSPSTLFYKLQTWGIFDTYDEQILIKRAKKQMVVNQNVAEARQR